MGRGVFSEKSPKVMLLDHVHAICSLFLNHLTSRILTEWAETA